MIGDIEILIDNHDDEDGDDGMILYHDPNNNTSDRKFVQQPTVSPQDIRGSAHKEGL